MDFKIEVNIIRVLGKIIGNGYLYKGVKLVYWCVDCCFVLVEVEVEYYDKIFLFIDVVFQVVDQDVLKVKFVVSNVNGLILLVIWIIMLWILFVNCVIFIVLDFDYVLVQIDGQVVILVKDLVESVMQCIGVIDYIIFGMVKGVEFELLCFIYLFMGFDVLVIFGDYVILDVGIGVVYIVFGYGLDDYVIGQKYGLEIVNLVGLDGIYLLGIYLMLDGVNVFKVNDIVVVLLQEKGVLLYVEKMQYSYLCCWCYKMLIIFCVMLQWFVSMDQKGLCVQLLKEIKGVQWILDWGQVCIELMVVNCFDWCIFCQCIWGVLMLLFVYKDMEELYLCIFELMEEVVKCVEVDGIQVWWDFDVKEIFGDEVDQYVKVLDILDVWFDFGFIYFFVVDVCLEFVGYVVDMYLEGFD